MRSPHVIVGLILSAALAAGSTRSQVVLSEVDFTPRNTEGQWIEILNMGQKQVDISTWSIYLETRTRNMPQQYFWGFPQDTLIDPGKFIRVFWFEKVQTGQKCKTGNGVHIYTGDTVRHFLFGLGAEKMDSSVGALALLSSQNNKDMNKKEIFQDWVQWGSTGFKRETLAIQNGKWVTGTFAPGFTKSGSTDPSLAYNYRDPLKPRSGSVHWFLDNAPTPCADNTGGGALALQYDAACRGSLSTSPPILSANGLPRRGANGGTGFTKFTISVTPVDTGGVAVWFLSAAKDKINLPAPFNCPFLLKWPFFMIGPFVQNGNTGEASFASLPTSVLVGAHFFNQAFVVDGKMGFGFTNGLELKFGQ